ncbi:hypothetical protein Q1695_008547 [Nippostrongylus brasiliensis]|nr:hypothetical protein Q1695_008547 [Nippostrongylus brasiliensis]
MSHTLQSSPERPSVSRTFFSRQSTERRSEDMSRSPERQPSPEPSEQRTPTRSRSRKLAGFASRQVTMFIL